MSFLSNIFKKKPGGTAVGNLLRTAASSIPVVGTVLGQGGNRIEVGQTKTNNQLIMDDYNNRLAGVTTATQPIVPASPSGIGDLLAGLGGSLGQQAASGALKKYWWLILLPFVLLGVWFMAKKNSRYPYSRRR